VTWGSDHSLISPSRDVLHLCTPNELITSNGASTTSDAGAPPTSNNPIVGVTTMLGDRVSARETITKGAADRARPTAAARWCKLASRVVIPPRSGLVFHLSGELSQEVGWQLFASVGLGNIVTELGRVVAIVDHG